MATFPDFKLLADHHLDYWTYTADQVKQLLGGSVNSKDVTNTCAVRMSHAMNNAGHKIPAKWGIITNRKSKAGQNYFLRVVNFREWMLLTFGKPEIEIRKKTGEAVKRSLLEGFKGVIGMEIGFGDSTGHFDLWHMNEFSAESSSGKDYLARATLIQLWSNGVRTLEAPV